MSDSITINSNTLLKLLIRRGTNAERQNVILSEGELGYTTDSKKLYIGDGSTYGGIQITGTKFIGTVGSITAAAPADVNDIAYSTGTRTLYYLDHNDGSTASDWIAIGGVYVGDSNGTIVINSDNSISIGNIAGAGLTMNSGNQLAIASSINVDSINPQTSDGWLHLPSKTAIGDINYTWPSSGNADNFLKLNSSGQLAWTAIGSTANSFVNSDIVPVGTILPYSSTTLPSNGRFLYCDGSYKLNTAYPVLCAILSTSFGALSTVGGDTYFKLPDLRGKVPMGYSNTQVYDLSGSGYTLTFASTGGRLKTTLTSSHIPEHAHNIISEYDGSVGSLGPSFHYLTSDSQYIARSVNSNNNESFEYNLYGVTSPPATLGSTSSYGTVSGSISPVMTLPPYTATSYIIKAIPDPIALCNITIGNGLTGFNTEISSATISINPLSGTYEIGLNNINAPKNKGFIEIDGTGRITTYDTSSAGATGTSQPQNTTTAHSFGFINYLYTPVTVASDTITATQPTWCGPVIVYPQIKDVNGTNATPTASIPNEAKNVILDVFVDFYSASNPVGIYGAMNTSLMNASTAVLTRGSTEYNITYVQSGTNNSRSSAASQQVIMPLSANTNDANLSFAMRGLNMNGTYSVRVIGWTL